MEHAYSHSLGALVQILARRELWGDAQAEVYPPSLGRALTLPANDLIALAEAPAPPLDQLIHYPCTFNQWIYRIAYLAV